MKYGKVTLTLHNYSASHLPIISRGVTRSARSTDRLNTRETKEKVVFNVLNRLVWPADTGPASRFYFTIHEQPPGQNRDSGAFPFPVKSDRLPPVAKYPQLAVPM